MRFFFTLLPGLCEQASQGETIGFHGHICSSASGPFLDARVGGSQRLLRHCWRGSLGPVKEAFTALLYPWNSFHGTPGDIRYPAILFRYLNDVGGDRKKEMFSIVDWLHLPFHAFYKSFSFACSGLAALDAPSPWITTFLHATAKQLQNDTLLKHFLPHWLCCLDRCVWQRNRSDV